MLNRPSFSKAKKKKSKGYTFIDLFCGMGGFRTALEEIGCSCVFSSDIDTNVQKTYQLNFDEQPKGDITKISATDIPDHDILCAGFPCQSFSIAGKRMGFEDTRGTMFFEVARIVKEKRPKVLFLENVKGLVNHDKGKTLNVILDTLNELGYNYTQKVLNAKDYNIPQNRERWYCVCFRKYLNLKISDFKFPEKKELRIHVGDLIEKVDNSNYQISKICESNINKFVKLKNINIDENTLAYEIRPSRCQFKQDGISPCLTAKMGTGGNNVPVIVKQKRTLTERECLKIMGYPDWYQIGRGSQAYKQIGNSVVVPIITEIAREIVRLLKKEDV